MKSLLQEEETYFKDNVLTVMQENKDLSQNPNILVLDVSVGKLLAQLIA
jgi:hypothetical protein